MISKSVAGLAVAVSFISVSSSVPSITPDGLNATNTICTSISYDSEIVNRCTKRLDDIFNLKDNWNGNGASHFDADIIIKCKKIVKLLPIEPEIYPTANASIQLEYEKNDGAYLEFEIFDNVVVMFKIESDGTEYLQNIYEIKRIAKEVEKFYEWISG